jgi:hypothetical protein
VDGDDIARLRLRGGALDRAPGRRLGPALGVVAVGGDVEFRGLGGGEEREQQAGNQCQGRANRVHIHGRALCYTETGGQARRVSTDLEVLNAVRIQQPQNPSLPGGGLREGPQSSCRSACWRGVAPIRISGLALLSACGLRISDSAPAQVRALH